MRAPETMESLKHVRPGHAIAAHHARLLRVVAVRSGALGRHRAPRAPCHAPAGCFPRPEWRLSALFSCERDTVFIYIYIYIFYTLDMSRIYLCQECLSATENSTDNCLVCLPGHLTPHALRCPRRHMTPHGNKSMHVCISKDVGTGHRQGRRRRSALSAQRRCSSRGVAASGCMRRPAAAAAPSPCFAARPSTNNRSG